ncbi:MAG: hypothetical protein J4N95_04080 [Chloroflexi bacterium]|nr:hypothetical protein [Chloroflexota bacterium]MCI0889269.1 hypothetical protein [Chloroflexota bacterium]
MKSAGFIAVLVVIGVVLVLLGTPSLASAVCTPSRIDQRPNADTVFVGEVVRERLLKDDDRYASTVRVAVTFKGSPGSAVIVFPLGSYEPDCSGGPRLQVGERVLLFLHSEYERVGRGTPIYLLDSQTAEKEIRYAADITRVRGERLSAAIEFANGGPVPEGMASFQTANGSWRDALGGMLIALGVVLLVRLGFSMRKRASS